MTDDLIKRADEALDGVTPGPWEATENDCFWQIVYEGWKAIADTCSSLFDEDGNKLPNKGKSGENARFIAAARQLVPDLRDEVLRLRADLARVTAERDAGWAVAEIVEYVLQDDLHNRLTPRVVDIAYSAFMAAKCPNSEDGGPSDWFTDTKPMVMRKIAEIRAAYAKHKEGRK